MTERIEWQQYLRPEERLLWQGRPEPPAKPMLWSPMEPGARIALSLLLGGLSATIALLFLPRMNGVYSLLVWALILPMLFAIWFFNGGQPIWTRFWLLRDEYALTDRRAIVARRVFGKYWLHSVPIEKMTPPRIAQQGPVAHLNYRSFTYRGTTGARPSYSYAFRYIREAGHVAHLLEHLLKSADRRPGP